MMMMMMMMMMMVVMTSKDRMYIPHIFEVNSVLISSNCFPLVSGRYLYKNNKKHIDTNEYVTKAPVFVAILTNVRNDDDTIKFDTQFVIVVIEFATPLICVGKISADIVHGIVPIPVANTSRYKHMNDSINQHPILSEYLSE